MAKLNYTSRDYPAVLAELRAKAQEVFPDWSDWNEANAGNAILGAVALGLDILNANQHAQYNECFWDSARHRKSIISLAKLVGYRLASARPAMVTIEARVDATAGGVTIPKGTKVYSTGLQPVRVFELQNDLSIPAGQTTGTATAKHAETKEESFVANGTSDQKFTLSQGPYLDDTVGVTVDGALWEYVETFVGSIETDRHFTIEVDDNDMATVVFGDGVLGARPTGAVKVRYEVGGGLLGNVPANTLNVVDGAFTDALGAGVQVAVTNPQAAAGGEPRESTERARKLAPYHQRATTRTVSREDYEQNALIDGVIRAKAVSEVEVPGLALNQTGVIIIPEAGGVPSTAMKDAVWRELVVNKPVPLGWDVLVLEPTYRPINVAVTITAQPGVDRVQLKTDAEQAIRRWFSPERTLAPEDDPWADETTWTMAGAYALGWGMTVYLGQLTALLFRDPQVRVFNATVNQPTGDTACGPLEFPVLGSLNVVVV